MNERERDRRNLNPVPEAVIAMNVFGERYAAQRGGSMDFWSSLSPSDKALCQAILSRVHEAERAHGRR